LLLSEIVNIERTIGKQMDDEKFISSFKGLLAECRAVESFPEIRRAMIEDDG
jgi:hypothetical protein